MANSEIVYIKPDRLQFDRQNPRMVEFEGLTDEKKILNALWSNMAVNEIVMSILANGFFQNEPLYVIANDADTDKYIVVEGNRRLAAVRSILNPSLIANGGMSKYESKITPDLVSQINAGIPVVVMASREDSWRLIGFKHVNGAAKWDSYAKAKYISLIHNQHGVDLVEIAEQIGDSNRTTVKLYQALMVLEQAEQQTSFKRSDIYRDRLYFSYLFSALGYTSVQEYLGLSENDGDERHPVLESRLPHLQELMLWLYGSKGRNIEPIITSQSKHLGMLNKILSTSSSIDTLKTTGDLSQAFESSYSASEVLVGSLVKAQLNIDKVMSKLGSYDGDRNTLEKAMDLADQADALFKFLKTKYQELNGISEKKRSID